MKIILFGLCIMVNFVHAQGCIVGNTPSVPRYICYDGRTLELSPRGYIWNAKRGCFISSIPCCEYNATHYAFYNKPGKLGEAYARCRHDYPFLLGQMQTH